MTENLKHFPDIMVDLETTHTQPDRGAILQISAVRFNLQTEEVDPNFFNRMLKIPAHRSWSDSTRAWWYKDKRELLHQIMSEGEDWVKVINDFFDWCKAPDPKLLKRFWSKPSHFDYQFISSYCADAELPNPFHYREATDLNSFLRGFYYPNPIPKFDFESDGQAHDAIFDVITQIKHLFAHVHGPEKYLDSHKNKTVEVEYVEIKPE